MQIIIGIAICYFVIILFGANKYKQRVIDDYEARLPRLYREFVDDCIELKSYLDLEERSSREPKMRKELNNMIDKYAMYYRKEHSKKFDYAIELGAKEYIKKN